MLLLLLLLFFCFFFSFFLFFFSPFVGLVLLFLFVCFFVFCLLVVAVVGEDQASAVTPEKLSRLQRLSRPRPLSTRLRRDPLVSANYPGQGRGIGVKKGKGAPCETLSLSLSLSPTPLFIAKFVSEKTILNAHTQRKHPHIRKDRVSCEDQSLLKRYFAHSFGLVSSLQL